MNDLDLQPEPAPATPVSPNKRKFSFRFPSTGHHDHDSKNERRNFSDEAQSITDLQVRHKSNNLESNPKNTNSKIYWSIVDTCKLDKNCLNNNDDYVDMSGNKLYKDLMLCGNNNNFIKSKSIHVSKLLSDWKITRKAKNMTVSDLYENVVSIKPRKRLDSSCLNQNFNNVTIFGNDEDDDGGIWL